MTDSIVTFVIPPVTKAEDCIALDRFLRAHPDQMVVIDGSGVKRLGGQAAQVLAAHIKCRAATLQIAAPSEGLRESLGILGLGTLLEQAGTA